MLWVRPPTSSDLDDHSEQTRRPPIQPWLGVSTGGDTHLQWEVTGDQASARWKGAEQSQELRTVSHGAIASESRRKKQGWSLRVKSMQKPATFQREGRGQFI